MTHQNHQTNGASLEDCHTNFFALTELYGIKWRKLVWGETSGGGEGEEGGAPLADPVISSYARCLAGDILCVWRRVPAPAPPDLYEMTTPTPPPLSLRAAKELWIFWYGEEPDLNGLVAPELIASQGEQGSWESGLSYECRSLLFKALHNLIERCLLSRDFVRLGKWFVQPYDGDEEDAGKSPWHLSFSFAFFLHGESTVCASVDVRQHPPVRTLTAKRLAKINSLDNQSDAKVILAPFGLEGTLTGRWWGEGAGAAGGAGGAGRVLEAWRQLYPLEQGCGAVEVALGGARLRYPRPYVLLTELCAPPARPDPPPPLADTARLQLAAHTTPDSSYVDANGDKTEDFADPTRKTPCTCAKWRRRRAPRPPPFHRRRPAPLHPPPHPHPPALRPTSGCLCSPGSMSGSPAAGGSAPPSAGAPPHSPHHQPTPTAQESLLSQSAVSVPTTLHTPAPTPDPLAPPTPAPPSLPSLPPKPYTQCYGAAGEVSGRPVLGGAAPRVDPHEDEHELHMLYDYSTVYAWLEHPVKRFKSDENRFREEMALGSTAGDLYAGHDHTTMAAMPDHTMIDVKLEKQDHNEDSKEYKNLFTSDGLCPTFKDLEQIFDTSDDAASGDETVRLALAAAAESKCAEERCGRGCPRAEELSKMFPTPPSMEAHAQPSPGFTLPDDLAVCATRLPPQGSPPPDAPIEDWSYVFKPPTVYKYVGSSKYAPLTSLPSSLLPPVSLPPHAVYSPRAPRPPPAPPAQRLRDETDAAPDTVGVKRSLSPGVERAAGGAGGAGGAGRAGAAAGGAGGTGAAGAVAARGGSPRRGAAPPACPLMLNVLLADTVLNVFRDHNFDSCTLCVCNAGHKMVGNILGADAATYLPGVAHREEEPSRCTCGFSAILNRRLAHRAGLFYEDEMEITGIAEEPGGGGGTGAGGGGALAEVARGVLSACAALPGGAAAVLGRAPRPRHADLSLNLLEYRDGGAAAALALRAALTATTTTTTTTTPAHEQHGPLVHRWPFIGARAPRSSRDVVRLMRRLRPLLQDAIQKRCCGARMWDGVSGPLTWRQFHRLAGRGNEDLCEPQPVPPLVVGHEREWVSVAPPALRHWERLALEPYAYARHVRYAALAHDAPALRDPLASFFRDLAAAYEACRLGVHRPATPAPHGLLRAAPLAGSDAPDEWAGALPAGGAGAALRGLAQALRGLVPALHADPPDADDALVIYLVEPPAPPHQRHLVLRALLRLAARAQEHLHRHNPLVKLVSVEALWARGGGAARALAFSVYTGARRLLHHRPDGKSLTGFGTAARDNLFVQSKDEKNRCPYALWSPAWVLAAPRTRCGAELAESWGGSGAAPGGVLFLAYCLSHDQRWLLAAATDARGELLDTAAINVHVPPRARRRRAPPARRLGLAKLMDWTLALMSQTAQPWRLVVGRVGRIGHGELKGWSWLLSRKHLERASNTLRELCGACAAVSGHVPGVLSACLVSTEPDSRLRLMADRFTPDERFSQASIQSHLHTPRDVSATHILVFPTSATTQSNPMTFEQPLANGEDGDMSMLLSMDIMGDEDIGEENMTDLLIGDMFNMFAQSSPRRGEEEGAASPLAAHLPHLRAAERAEPLGAVLQQPLALGYLVSTAPLPRMPRWWWAAAHHLHDACPAFLKTALHLHSADDDSLTARAHRHDHPLDSQTTTDVLRYVLEGYNALSWLTLDTNTHDRLSCLPLHVQVLMQLYHTAAAIG